MLQCFILKNPLIYQELLLQFKVYLAIKKTICFYSYHHHIHKLILIAMLLQIYLLIHQSTLLILWQVLKLTFKVLLIYFLVFSMKLIISIQVINRQMFYLIQFMLYQLHHSQTKSLEILKYIYIKYYLLIIQLLAFEIQVDKLYFKFEVDIKLNAKFQMVMVKVNFIHF